MVERTPLLLAQRMIRSKLKHQASGARLHAKNLADRLLFESSLVRGVFRLINQSLIFALLLIALSLSGDPATKRGIYNSLNDAFDFDGLRDMKSRDAFMKALPHISSTSKTYFLLSSTYFDTKQAGNVQLLGPLKTFSQPMLLGGIDLTIQAKDISFTAWVKTTPQVCVYLCVYSLSLSLCPCRCDRQSLCLSVSLCVSLSQNFALARSFYIYLSLCMHSSQRTQNWTLIHTSTHPCCVTIPQLRGSHDEIHHYIMANVNV